MNDNILSDAKGKFQEGLIRAYFSRPRKDSPKRFLARLFKPKRFRFQSLLRGAMANAAKSSLDSCKCKESQLKRTDGMPHHVACAYNRKRNELRRDRQQRIQPSASPAKLARVVTK